MSDQDSSTKASSSTAAPQQQDDVAAEVLQEETNYLLVASYVTISALWAGAQLVDVPYVANLLFLVTSILYAACHKSLVLREDQAITRAGGHVDEATGERIAPGPSETMKKEDAMQFPLLGSASLFTLYLAFKFFDKDVVNLIISAYFVIIGCLALTATFSPLLGRVLPKSVGDATLSREVKIRHPLPEFIGGESPWDLGFEVSGAEIISFLLSAVFCGFYFKTKHWALNNVLGICFCLQGIERFSLGTYKIGAILLVGLFFYDIFWVFGTDVMVTVAKSLDGPIKILFPRSLVPNATTNKIDLSLLGLGDIVIPGFFLALLLRFDAENALVRAVPTDVHASFPKPYFHSCLIAYVFGLATTLFVMIRFDAAQPALLYLVPACLGSSLMCAAVRGELGALFAYSEETDEEDDDEDGGEDEKAEGKDGKKEEAKKDK